MPVAYEITLKGERTERVDGADAYAQEGQLTTFFRTDPERRIVDRWSVRLASFRTSEVMAVRRLDVARAGADGARHDDAWSADASAHDTSADDTWPAELAWSDRERSPRLRTVG